MVVKGVRGSLARSLEQKRYSDGVVDGITSEDIGDFPDLNISESLQRITGVTINRVLGEGQQVSVRGLAPEFTRVTINGQTVTSGNSGREVDFDVFASELFSNVSLTKTPSAALTEGGLAATLICVLRAHLILMNPFLQYQARGLLMRCEMNLTPGFLRSRVIRLWMELWYPGESFLF